jgi:hypothetical protein
MGKKWLGDCVQVETSGSRYISVAIGDYYIRKELKVVSDFNKRPITERARSS